MRKLKGIIIDGEWLGENVEINGLFRAICTISPVVMREFVRLINKTDCLYEAVKIDKFEFPNNNSINIEFSNNSLNGVASLYFKLQDGKPELVDGKILINQNETEAFTNSEEIAVEERIDIEEVPETEKNNTIQDEEPVIAEELNETENDKNLVDVANMNFAEFYSVEIPKEVIKQDSDNDDTNFVDEANINFAEFYSVDVSNIKTKKENLSENKISEEKKTLKTVKHSKTSTAKQKVKQTNSEQTNIVNQEKTVKPQVINKTLENTVEPEVTEKYTELVSQAEQSVEEEKKTQLKEKEPECSDEAALGLGNRIKAIDEEQNTEEEQEDLLEDTNIDVSADSTFGGYESEQIRKNPSSVSADNVVQQQMYPNFPMGTISLDKFLEHEGYGNYANMQNPNLVQNALPEKLMTEFNSTKNLNNAQDIPQVIGNSGAGSLMDSENSSLSPAIQKSEIDSSMNYRNDSNPVQNLSSGVEYSDAEKKNVNNFADAISDSVNNKADSSANNYEKAELSETQMNLSEQNSDISDSKDSSQVSDKKVFDSNDNFYEDSIPLNLNNNDIQDVTEFDKNDVIDVGEKYNNQDVNDTYSQADDSNREISDFYSDFYDAPYVSGHSQIDLDMIQDMIANQGILEELEMLRDELEALKHKTRPRRKKITLQEFLESIKESRADSYGEEFRVLVDGQGADANLVEDNLFIAGNRLYRWGDTLYLEE